MSPQTLCKPETKKKPAPAPTRSGDHRQPVPPALRTATPRHAAPRTTAPRHAAERPARAGARLWTVAGMTVLFVLSLLAGVLLAVHGPSQPSSSAGSGRGSSVILEPGTPATPWATAPPARIAESRTPDDTATPGTPREKEPQPALPTSTMVTLKPGDTLYALAPAHDTTVKALQQLNNLGSSTLIYAGHGIRVPTTAAPGATPSVSGGSTVAPAPATKPAKPARGTKKNTGKPAPTAVVAFARAQLGKPYIWGGTGPRGFDCSGLVMRAWEKAGVKLPRTTWGQVKAGKETTRSALVPGDLVITSGGGHVQLYIGNGKVIHAPRPGRAITIAPLTNRSGVVSYRHITA